MSTEATQEDRSPSYLPSEADAGESVRLIREGLPAEAFEWLKGELGLTVGTLGDIVHISRRTASRRKKEGRLKPDESERVLRLIRSYRSVRTYKYTWIGGNVFTDRYQRAVEVLGTREDAREWLQEENYALGEETPLQFADTEPGAQRFRQLLGHIEHGIFS